MSTTITPTPWSTISAPRQPLAPYEHPDRVAMYLGHARGAGVRAALDHLVNEKYSDDPVRRRARALIALQVGVRRQLVIAGLGDVHLEHTAITREKAGAR
jgi:hypothetical protein